MPVGYDVENAQRWAVTGAAGTIGRALRQHLATSSFELVAIDVSEVTPVAESERIVRCDVGDLAGLEAAFAGCAGVIRDDAMEHGDCEPLTSIELQGGPYATVEYSLDRMKAD